MENVRFRVLGPLDVVANGTRMGTGSPMQQAVLAMLLTAPRHVISTDRLIDALWGDQPPSRARHSIQTYISNLRRLFRAVGLGPRIETRSPGYAIDLDPDEFDASRFETLVGEARKADDLAAVELFDAALEQWRGAAYAGLADREAFQIEAIRLEELRLVTIEQRLERLHRLGRDDQSIPDLEALIAAEPLRERPRELAMRSLHRVGRQPDALRLYADYRQLLAEELGVEPSRELQQLELAILRDEVDRPKTPTGAWVVEMPDITLRTFERAPGETITFAEFGEGPVLVKPMGHFSSLDLVAAGLDYRRSALFARLADDFRVVTYDRYGVGLSKGEVTDFSHDTAVAELVGLIEHLDLWDITMYGESAAGSLVVAATSAVPERVSRLVLLGCCPSPADVYDEGVMEHFVPLVRDSWGVATTWLTALHFPGASAEILDADARLQRRSATKEVAAGYMEQYFESDVRDLLPKIEVPTLVLHYRGDRSVPFQSAQQFAAGLPNSRLKLLEGNSHTPRHEDIEKVASVVVEFTKKTGFPPTETGSQSR